MLNCVHCVLSMYSYALVRAIGRWGSRGLTTGLLVIIITSQFLWIFILNGHHVHWYTQHREWYQKQKILGLSPILSHVTNVSLYINGIRQECNVLIGLQLWHGGWTERHASHKLAQQEVISNLNLIFGGAYINLEFMVILHSKWYPVTIKLQPCFHDDKLETWVGTED